MSLFMGDDFGGNDFERQAFSELLAMQGQAVVLKMDSMDAFLLISQVQLATRHPQNNGIGRERVEAIIRALGERLAPAGSAAAGLIAMGWNPEKDVEA